MTTIVLPWPPMPLNPNKRVHWARKNTHYQRYKMAAYGVARKAGVGPTVSGAPRLVVTIHPPDKRRRDIDNVIASMKAAQDGIAWAMGVDDSVFRVRWPEEFSEPRKGGEIVIEIQERANE